MGTKRIKKLVAIVGKKADGKPIYRNMGSMFKSDDDKFSIKIDAIPTGDWNGWVNIFELDGEQVNQQQGLNGPRATQSRDDFDDDIPF